MPYPRVHDYLFRKALRHRILVIPARIDRISRPAPVYGIHPVPALGHGTDIDHTHVIRIWRSKHCPDHIFRSPDIDFQSLLREIVSCRRDHSSYMEHIVGA